MRLIEDLRNDMKDGVALIELIEIVGKYNVHCILKCEQFQTKKITRGVIYMDFPFFL